MIPVHYCFPFTFHKEISHKDSLWVKDVHCWLVLWSLNGIWWNLTELNALCQVFLAIRQHVLTSDWLRHFSTLDRRLKCTIVIMRCQDKSIRPFHSFDFSETLNGIWGNFTGSKKSLSNTNVCVFRANKKKTMAVLASDWLRHFPLLLCSRLCCDIEPTSSI